MPKHWYSYGFLIVLQDFIVIIRMLVDLLLVINLNYEGTNLNEVSSLVSLQVKASVLELFMVILELVMIGIKVPLVG